MAKNQECDRRELVGVMPAAGRAIRLGVIPCSKEILPVAIVPDASNSSGLRVKVAVECALEAFRCAGADRVVVVTSPDKQDVASYLDRYRHRDMAISTTFIENSAGAPSTIEVAMRSAPDADIALAFPDIQFSPQHAIADIASFRHDAGADVALALVPSGDGHKVDLVELDASGRVVSVTIKPGAGCSGLTWVTAVWSPSFSKFLHATLDRMLQRTDNPVEGIQKPTTELFVGDIIREALIAGLDVRGIVFQEGKALDIGTPESLQMAWSGRLP